jgi:hypothetical protein
MIMGWVSNCLWIISIRASCTSEVWHHILYKKSGFRTPISSLTASISNLNANS